MLILDATTKTLELKLGGAVATTELDVTTHYTDITTTAYTPANTRTKSTGATAVTIVAAPAASTQRHIETISVYNNDTASATVTIQENDNATLGIIRKHTLLTLEHLEYEAGKGWSVFSASGGLKSTGVTSIAGTAAEITVTPTTGDAVVSLPTALTFTGKTVTGGTFASPTLSGTVIGTYTLGGTPTLGATLDANGRTISGGLTILSPAAGTVSLIVNTAASPSVAGLHILYNGSLGVEIFRAGARNNALYAEAFDNGAGGGNGIELRSNINATTPAAGYIETATAGGSNRYIWVDNSTSPGLYRLHTVEPTNANDQAGTVIGSQTSWWELKENVLPYTDYSKALTAVVNTPLYSFDLDNRHYDVGYMIYEEDKGKWFSWNDDSKKGQIPALNERQLFGYLAASIKALNERIEKLELINLPR